MNPEDILKFMVVLAIIVVPALAVSARLALRPIVEAILRLRDGYGPATPKDDARIAALEAEVRQLRAEFERLADTAEFDAQLQAPTSAGRPRLFGGAAGGRVEPG